MNQDEVKNNLLAPSQWLRMLIMAGFILAAWVVWLVVVVLMITQTVTVLITGLPNANLKRFGLVTSAYLHQIISFLVYGTEARPFPFAPFPDCDVSVDGICDPSWAAPGPRQTEASATVHTPPFDTAPGQAAPTATASTPTASASTASAPTASAPTASASTAPMQTGPDHASVDPVHAAAGQAAGDAVPPQPGVRPGPDPVEEFEAIQTDLAAADSDPFPYDLASDQDKRDNKD